MLIKLRDYLQLVGSASLTDLSRHFDIQESAIQGMLSQWVRKGQVTMLSVEPTSCASGSCSSCSLGDCGGSQIWYRWQY